VISFLAISIWENIKDTEWSVLFGWRLLKAPQLNDVVFTGGDKSRVSRMKNNWTDTVKMASNNTTYIHTSIWIHVYIHIHTDTIPVGSKNALTFGLKL